VGFARSEQYPVGDDDGGTPAGLQQSHEEGYEEQLGLFGLDDLLEVFRAGLVIQ
jgi:hypothetical protein